MTPDRLARGRPGRLARRLRRRLSHAKYGHRAGRSGTRQFRIPAYSMQLAVMRRSRLDRSRCLPPKRHRKRRSARPAAAQLPSPSWSRRQGLAPDATAGDHLSEESARLAWLFDAGCVGRVDEVGTVDAHGLRCATASSLSPGTDGPRPHAVGEAARLSQQLHAQARAVRSRPGSRPASRTTFGQREPAHRRGSR